MKSAPDIPAGLTAVQQTHGAGAQTDPAPQIIAYAEAVWRWLVEDALARAAWLIAALATFFILRALRGVVSRLVQSKNEDDASFRNLAAKLVGETWTIFLFLFAIYLFSPMLGLPEAAASLLKSAVIILFAIQAAVWASTLLKSLLVGYAARTAGDYSTLANASALLRVFVNVAVWAVALLFILSNLGIDVTALVAGLGVGGIAIGLAAQGIFADLFASLSIVLDKPFVRGDFIIFGDMMGTVEKIGLKTTRIRSLSGEQIVVSNTNLLGERIRNYQRLYERRVVFEVGVTYQTPYEKVRRIPGWIREAIEAVDKTRFDRSHFKSYGDSALVFETVYYALTPDYNAYMDMQQAINLALLKRFEEEGVSFAYPTRTLFIERGAAEG